MNAALLAAYWRYRSKGYRPNTAWMLAIWAASESGTPAAAAAATATTQ